MVHSSRSGTLAVPGAQLGFAVTGSGPLLLLSDSGGGEARRREEVIARLATHYTVVSYDRRGFHRSPLDDPTEAVTFETHTADTDRLLAALTDEPALVLGCGLGAVNALMLAVAHPERVHTVVSHVPFAPFLMAEPERSAQLAAFERLEQTYQHSGLAATIVRMGEFLGIDISSSRPVHYRKDADEPTLSSQMMTAERIANFDWLFRNEMPAVRRADLAPAAIRSAPVRIVSAVGRSIPAQLPGRQCALALADLVGGTAVEFPGGYNSHLTRPDEFAASLRTLLADLPAVPSNAR